MATRKSPYSKVRNTKVTPQSQPIPGSKQVPNSAGGYSFAITPWQRLRRFLILGTEKGTYYISEKDLTEQGAKCIEECLDLDYVRVLREVGDVSDGALAPKNTPTLFALAMAFAHEKLEVRQEAAKTFPRVVRIGTHLLQFAELIDGMRGWGNLVRRVVSDWYLNHRDSNSLAYQLAKYQQREGWSQRDVLRLSHPRAGEGPTANALGWAVGAIVPNNEGGFVRQKFNPETKQSEQVEVVEDDFIPDIILGFELAKKAATVEELLPLIEQYDLTREMIPTQFLSDERVWARLLPNTKTTALIRNLGNLSKSGYLTEGKHENIEYVTGRLRDRDELTRGRIHPIQVLLALTTYEAGKGFRGHGEWPVVPKVVSALNDAFYSSFQLVEPIGQNIYIGLDVSSSMNGSLIAGTNMSAAVGAAAMAMLYVRTEPRLVVKAFSDELKDLPLNDKMSLAEVMARTSAINFGGTDCSLPMIDATRRGLEIDLFMVITDAETWAGGIHPPQALKAYRQKMNREAKLVVVAMTSNGFTIADPNDAGMLDVVGFDASVPNIIRSFALGQI